MGESEGIGLSESREQAVRAELDRLLESPAFRTSKRCREFLEYIVERTINGGAGNDEWIMTRGPTNSWQTDSSLGSSSAIYIEDCTFNNCGYTDYNYQYRPCLAKTIVCCPAYKY